MTSLLVTVGSNGIKAKSKGVNGKVYLTLLGEHIIISAYEALTAKGRWLRSNMSRFLSKTTLKLTCARGLGIGFRLNAAFK
jgi:hypothetical protein